jgi:phosphoribosylanthranilate isomerase
MWIKICGMTSLQDALAASTFGADAVGFVFADSPRRVTREQARSISLQLPPRTMRVGVFADAPPERVRETIRYCGLDMVQLHGTESPGYCASFGQEAIKAITVRDWTDVTRSRRYRGCTLLFDADHSTRDGGPGPAFDWRLVHLAQRCPPPIIAGGLNASNVAEAIKVARPYGVDISSGVEREPGRKDRSLMYEFIERARKADFEVSTC